MKRLTKPERAWTVETDRPQWQDHNYSWRPASLFVKICFRPDQSPGLGCIVYLDRLLPLSLLYVLYHRTFRFVSFDWARLDNVSRIEQIPRFLLSSFNRFVV
jgi:hypothetical protein